MKRLIEARSLTAASATKGVYHKGQRCALDLANARKSCHSLIVSMRDLADEFPGLTYADALRRTANKLEGNLKKLIEMENLFGNLRLGK